MMECLQLIEELAIARRSRSDLENHMDLRNDELQEELRKTKQTAIGIFLLCSMILGS